MPVRVYEIARKLRMESKDVLSKAKELGIATAKVPSSSLDRITAEYLEDHLIEDRAEMRSRAFFGLGVGNFKAFGATQAIPVRPITLVFGANSSGKSSVLHSLLLACHAVETGEFDVSKTKLGGESMDLGGFRQFVHRRDAGRRVELAAEFNPRVFFGNTWEIFKQCRSVRVTLSIGMALNDLGLAAAGERPRLISYEVETEGRSILRMSRRPDDTMKLDRVDEEVLGRLVNASIISNSTMQSVDVELEAQQAKKTAEALIATLQFTCSRLLPDGLVGEETLAARLPQLAPVARGNRAEELANILRLFLPRALAEVVKSINSGLDGQLARVCYLGPLRSFPSRHYSLTENDDRNWTAGGGYAWEVVRRDKEIRENVNAWLGAANRLQTPYQLMVQRSLAPGQIRGAIAEEFWTVLQELETCTDYRIDTTQGEQRPHIQFANFDGDAKADALVERILKEHQHDGIEELVLVDKRTDTIVSHRDVGIGVSQVLPVLVHAYADREQIVAIEQPEIHLHPALQAELGDLFIESALGKNRNTFVIETHSEHLILRILRRVRETTEGTLEAGRKPIRPEDISVVYVDPTSKGSVVKHLPVTPDGDFSVPWPGGFFAERLADLP